MVTLSPMPELSEMLRRAPLPSHSLKLGTARATAAHGHTPGTHPVAGGVGQAALPLAPGGRRAGPAPGPPARRDVPRADRPQGPQLRRALVRRGGEGVRPAGVLRRGGGCSRLRRMFAPTCADGEEETQTVHSQKMKNEMFLFLAVGLDILVIPPSCPMKGVALWV